MDKAGEKQKLENEKTTVESYLNHPFTRRILEDNAEAQERLVNLLCDMTVHDIASFFAHFEAIGHLRGLRRSKAIITNDLDEIKEKLKEL